MSIFCVQVSVHLYRAGGGAGRPVEGADSIPYEHKQGKEPNLLSCLTYIYMYVYISNSIPYEHKQGISRVYYHVLRKCV